MIFYISHIVNKYHEKRPENSGFILIKIKTQREVRINENKNRINQHTYQAFPKAFTKRKVLRGDLKEAKDVVCLSSVGRVTKCGNTNNKSLNVLCHKP